MSWRPFYGSDSDKERRTSGQTTKAMREVGPTYDRKQWGGNERFPMMTTTTGSKCTVTISHKIGGQRDWRLVTRAKRGNATSNNQPVQREDERAVQEDRATTSHATTSQSNKRTKRRRNMIGQQRQCKQQEDTQRKDKRAVQPDRATGVTHTNQPA